jgi:hypothetical protein
LAAPRCADGLPRALLAALLGLSAAQSHAYEDGAPPGHTGGFGEPDCSACHSGFDRNAPAGELAVEGLPAAYAPGETYRLAILLQHPELASGGLQLAIRTRDGAQAGELTPASARTAVVNEAGLAYLQHTREGTRPGTDGRICWEFDWRAPQEAEPVVLNVAANAANDDFSSLGDFVYTLERKVEAGPANAPAGKPRRGQEPASESSRKR